jgi:hypothetical protein
MGTKLRNIINSVAAAGSAAPAALASGLAASASGSTPEAAALAFVAGVLGGVASYAINRLNSGQDAAAAAAPATADEIALNGHLSRLAGAALRTLIEEEAKKLPADSRQRAAYTAAAARAEKAWEQMLKQGSFEELTSDRLTDDIAAQAVTPGQVEVLEARHWHPLIQFLLRVPGQPPPPNGWIDTLATACVTGFTAQLHGQAKLSSEKEPAAFAALLIQFLAELRLTQREHSESLTRLEEKSDTNAAKITAVARQITALSGQIKELAGEITNKPLFNWESLTDHLAKATTAHEEARAFYKSQNQNFDELLNLVRELKAGQKKILDGQGIIHKAITEVSVEFREIRRERNALLSEKQANFTYIEQLERQLNYEKESRSFNATREAIRELLDSLCAQLKKIRQLENNEGQFASFKDHPHLRADVFPEIYQILKRFCGAAKGFNDPRE